VSNWLKVFSFVVAAANSSTALTSDRVNFINEDQAGALSLLLNKSRTRSAYSHEHFHEFGTGDAKKWYSCFSSDRFG